MLHPGGIGCGQNFLHRSKKNCQLITDINQLCVIADKGVLEVAIERPEIFLFPRNFGGATCIERLH